MGILKNIRNSYIRTVKITDKNKFILIFPPFNKDILENLKTRVTIFGGIIKYKPIEYDIVKFDEELSTYVDVPCNYLKYMDFINQKILQIFCDKIYFYNMKISYRE